MRSLLFIASCGHLLLACSQQSDPAKSLASADPEGSSTVRRAAQPKPERAPATGPEPHQVDLATHMRDHFGMVTQARDAVIRGQRKDAHGPLVWLAQHNYGGEVPPTWAPHIEAMQAAARQAESTASPAELGTRLVELAAQCGRCHAAQHKVVDFGPVGFERLLEEGAPEDIKGRMHRHLWVVERMWESLVAPDPRRFAVAAEALAEATELTGASKSVAQGAAEVQALAARAKKASTPEARAKIVGEFLGRCSSCHTAHGVSFSD